MIRGDELTIRGCELPSKLIKQNTKEDWDRYSVPLSPSSSRPPPPFMEGLLHYIVLFGPSWFYTY